MPETSCRYKRAACTSHIASFCVQVTVVIQRIPCLLCKIRVYLSVLMATFRSKSVKDLQQFLRDRGVSFNGLRKASLVELCETSVELGLTVDPDGLVEDRVEVVNSKLTTHNNILLPNPATKPDSDFSNSLSSLPPISISKSRDGHINNGFIITARKLTHAVKIRHT